MIDLRFLVMQKKINVIKFLFFKLLFIPVRLMSLLPLSVINVLGSYLGILVYHLKSSRRNVGIKNLSLCFPNMTDIQKKIIIKNHFKCISSIALSYGMILYGSAKRIRNIVTINNMHYLLEHYQKRPVIILCPHFAGLDFAALRLSLEIIGYSIYSKQSNSFLTEEIKKARTRFMNDGEIFERQEGLRTIIKKLKENNTFFYLPDQDFGDKESIYVPFFAFETCATIKALPRIAKLTDAVIIPSYILKKHNKFVLEFLPAWQNYPTDDIREDVIRMNKFIENVVIDNLEQYFWLHKRFKTQPNVERGYIYKGINKVKINNINSKYSHEHIKEIFKYSLGEDIANAVTHTVGVFFSLYALISLSWMSGRHGNAVDTFAFVFYGTTILFMFLMSALYHSMVNYKARVVFKRMDHIAIFILIIGSYTPYVFSLVRTTSSYFLYIILVIIGIIGIIFKSIYAGKWKKMSTFIYFLMGWSAFCILPQIIKLASKPCLYLMFTSGITYSIGGIIYASAKFKYSHMVWHLMVLIGVVTMFCSINFFIIQYR